MDKELFVSLVIPVHNGSQYLEKCLSSVESSLYQAYEVIIVDDGSTDDSVEIANRHGAKVLKLGEKAGPAGARNFGARAAKGDILFFIDCDIVIKKETITQIVEDFNEKTDVVALFGSYDDSPEEQNFFSQYMNLRHHFIHQESNSEAVTFWSGCGAIRSDIFRLLDGFDENKYARPCIEDIEMGFRLKKMGYRILLDKRLQVKHLKKWTLRSVIRTDILDRAIPWSKLILESQEMVSDLNLHFSQKISTAIVALMVAGLPLCIVIPQLLLLNLFLLMAIMIINHRLFTFFLKQRGALFAVFAVGMYLLYFFYSGVTYVSCWVGYRVRN